MGWPWVLLLPTRSTNTATFRHTCYKFYMSKQFSGAQGKPGKRKTKSRKWAGEYNISATTDKGKYPPRSQLAERRFYICAQEKCRKKVLRSNIALYVLLCKITVQHWQHCQLSCKSSRNSSNRTARGDGSQSPGAGSQLPAPIYHLPVPNPQGNQAKLPGGRGKSNLLI